MPMTEYLTVPQVAERLQVNRHKVLRWIASGELRAADVSQSQGERPRYRVAMTEFARFYNSRLTVPTPAKKPDPKAKRVTVREFVH